ncbi:hypothetical protein FACS1894191_2420 [Clostridia bacterium]|nr:hypothetical protein FACS1894191_2420 [Clostridia bacterium]
MSGETKTSNYSAQTSIKPLLCYIAALAAVLLVVIGGGGNGEKSDIYKDLSNTPAYIRRGFDAADLVTSGEWLDLRAAVGDGNVLRVAAAGLPGLPRFKPTQLFAAEPELFTIALKIDVGESFMESLGDRANPAMYIAGISDNWALYINGNLQWSEFPSDGNTREHRSRVKIYIPLDSEDFVEGVNIISFKILGDPTCNDTGIFYSPFFIDEYKTIAREYNRDINILFAGMFIFAGAYFVFAHISYKKETYYLWFGTSSMFVGIYLASKAQLFAQLIPNSQISARIEMFALFAMTGCLINFIETVINDRISLPAKIYSYIFCPACFIIYAITCGGQFAINMLVFWQYVTILIILYDSLYTVTFTIIKDRLRWRRERNRGAEDRGGDTLRERPLVFDMAIAFLILAICAGFELTQDLLFRRMFSTEMISYGFSIFIVGISARLVSDVGVVYRSLEHSNERLELAVAESTAELKEKIVEAEMANRAKSDFLARTSHEIRTPMNAIIGMSELALQSYGKPEALDNIVEIKRAGMNLLSIINDILDFSKIEAGGLDLNPDLYEMGSLLNDVLSIIQVYMGDKAIELVTELSEKIPAVLIGDVVRVRQILLNLLSNAIKYTHEGTITFSAFHTFISDDRVKLTFVVSDTGIGIRERDLPKLFGDFVRVDQHVNNSIQGTGLGLAIARNLCRAMDGDITAESEYGKGTAFTATVFQGYTDESEMGTLHKELYSSAEASGERLIAPAARILVVDDIDINLKVALGFLAVHSIIADTAANGKDAVDAVRAKDYDIVFMDHMMPDIDGIEATRRIRALEGERFRTVPIIALTANAMTGAKDTFIEAGMNDFISKPIIAEKLKQMLLKYLPPERIQQNASIPAQGSGSVTASAKNHDGAIRSGKAASAIDERAGIENSAGSEALFRQLCKDFAKNQKHAHTQILAALTDDDIKLANRVAHNLKTTARTIGAMGLGEAAFVVEQALTEGKNNCTDGQMAVLSRELEAVLNELADDEDTRPERAAATGVLDTDRAAELIERLTPLLKSRIASAAELLDEIAEVFMPLGDVASRFCEQIENLDFKAAADILCEIQLQITEKKEDK